MLKFKQMERKMCLEIRLYSDTHPSWYANEKEEEHEEMEKGMKKMKSRRVD